MAALREDVLAAKEQFNSLFGNMFTFDDDDMVNYDKCYADVFKNGTNFSFMSSVFYAQFSAELLIGLLASNPFRKYLVQKIDEEAEYKGDVLKELWHDNMKVNRFGLPGRNYTKDNEDVMDMMNATYIKIQSLNDWYGTDEGKNEFDMYCISIKAQRDIKRIICEYPYLIRRFDHDKRFANEIMEHAGVIAEQIKNSTGM